MLKYIGMYGYSYKWIYYLYLSKIGTGDIYGRKIKTMDVWKIWH